VDATREVPPWNLSFIASGRVTKRLLLISEFRVISFADCRRSETLAEHVFGNEMEVVTTFSFNFQLCTLLTSQLSVSNFFSLFYAGGEICKEIH